MQLYGFQKMTMLDFPGKVACTAFTAGCNFRCPFCHNASLVTHIDAGAAVDEQEVFAYLEKRRGVLDGLCLTGGEPLLYDGVEDFLKRVRSLGLAIKVDTNGSFPDRLRSLVEEGLVDYVAMDIKNCRERYAETVGLSHLDLAPIEQSVSYLLSGPVDYEFRTTVVKDLHTPQDVVAIGEWVKGAKRFFLQNFVDSGDLISAGLCGISPSEMREYLSLLSPFVENISLRGL